MPNPAKLASSQVDEALRRWSMWGIKGNRNCLSVQGDFCTDRKVAEVLPNADVVVSDSGARENEGFE